MDRSQKARRVVVTTDALTPVTITNRVTLAMLEELTVKYRSRSSKGFIEDFVEKAYLRI